MDPKERDVLRDRSYDLLLKNRREKEGYQYTVPSPGWYPYQWLWDSCFHAIVLAHFEPKDAKKELRSLLSQQYENGLIPHIIYWEKQDGVIDIDWGRDKTSSITQPPMIAYAAWMIYVKDHDKAFLNEIYPHLYHYYNYLLSERDPRRNHLAGIINPDESGEDDSPRFDESLGLPPKHDEQENFEKRLELVEKNKVTCDFDAPFCMKKYFWIKDVPFNAILVKNLSLLAMIAKEIGRMDEAIYFRNQELRVADAMRDRMEEDGVFYSLRGEDYKKIKIKTWATFSPLFAKILSPDEVDFLVKEYLRNDDLFGARYPVPTVAKDEDSYNPNGFWRGPTWIASNWFIYHGLMDYGYYDDAERIRRQSAELVSQTGFFERFNPETGEGIGATEFTWGTLVVDMFERNA